MHPNQINNLPDWYHLSVVFHTFSTYLDLPVPDMALKTQETFDLFVALLFYLFSSHCAFLSLFLHFQLI